MKTAVDKLPPGDQFLPLYFGIDNNSGLRCYAKGSLGYGLTSFSQQIRGTLTHGTVTYTSSEESNLMVTCSGQVSYKDQKTCVLETLLKFPKGILDDDLLQLIDISALGINDSEVPT